MLAITIDMSFAFYTKSNTANLDTQNRFTMCGAASSLSICSQREDVKQISSNVANSTQFTVTWRWSVVFLVFLGTRLRWSFYMSFRGLFW